MMKLESFRSAFAAHKKQVARLGWLILLVACAWFYLAAVIVGKNGYWVYRPAILLWGIAFIPLIAAGLALLLGGLVLPNFSKTTKKERLTLLGLSLGIAAGLAWLIQPPFPAVVQPHTLRLVATGAANPESRGSQIEIEGLRLIDGTPIPLQQLQLSGDWQLVGGKLVSKGGQPDSVALLQGSFTGGVELRLNFQRRAGKLQIQLDDHSQEIDLYSPWNTAGTAVVFPSPWAGVSGAGRGLAVGGLFLYFLGIAAFLFLGSLVFQMRLLPAWLEWAALAAVCGLIFLLYVGIKFSYPNFSAVRLYGDTITYVRTAQIPLTSINFWVNDRTFPLPLFYKITGMNLDNYTDREVMRSVAGAQAWVSIACWTALALALAASLRKRWLAPVAFALVLFFSLSLDISLWDQLMYSESLSFSLFALLVAMWLGLGELPARWWSSLLGPLYLLALIGVTILYSFIRDTNLYFLLAGAGIFVLAALFKRTAPGTRKYYWIYALAVLGLFLFQNMTVRLGNRWQIHIFDHLARRILLDEPTLDYFKAAGFPMSPRLLETTQLGVAEYQDLYMNSSIPEYAAVREWVNRSGQSTYIRFLLTHPEKSILVPAQNYGYLINGSNVEYRYPVYPGQPVPGYLLDSDRKFYFRSWPAFSGALLVLLIGAALYVSGRDRRHPAWLVLAVLAVAVLPLSFMVWNGNPLEIERHASQIGIQFRLAAWAGLLLLVDWAAVKNLE